MDREEYRTDTEIDEYLWPLTGDVSTVDWESFTEELRIRKRLQVLREESNELAQRLQKLNELQSGYLHA
jgi:hypothetical protein